jgi:hypothetical protein
MTIIKCRGLDNYCTLLRIPEQYGLYQRHLEIVMAGPDGGTVATVIWNN